MHPKCPLKTLITMYQTARCPNPDLSWILAILSTSYPVPKNIRNKWCVDGNTTLGKLSYRTAVCFVTQRVFNSTYFFHQLCTQYFTFCLSDWGCETWNTSSLDIRVRITYDEFQFSQNDITMHTIDLCTSYTLTCSVQYRMKSSLFSDLFICLCGAKFALVQLIQ